MEGRRWFYFDVGNWNSTVRVDQGVCFWCGCRAYLYMRNENMSGRCFTSICLAMMETVALISAAKYAEKQVCLML